MAEIAYVRKYRPNTFSDYLGDDTKKLVLSRMDNTQNYPQVWLFYGERGCGKTSAARLLAPEYLCQHKVDGHACGKCEICTELQETLIAADVNSVTWGVTELNIASDSGKEAINGVLEDAMQAPMAPLKYKILIFDECHMATRQAQNLLLKYTEEPPKHLIIIFCTTDKDKMLSTLLDRCQVKIHVKKASLEDITQRMLYICKQESIKTSLEALKLIARKRERNPRKCIMTLEEIAKGNSMVVDIAGVRQFTDGIDSSLYIDYIKAAKGGFDYILPYIKDLKEKEIDFKDFLNGFSRFIMDSLFVKYGLMLDEFSVDFVKTVKTLFKEYTSSQLDTLLQIVETANNDVANAGEQADHAEMVVCLTALRISKLKILSLGLQNEEELAVQENRKGNKRGVARVQEEIVANSRIKKEEANESLLQEVFGHTIVEVEEAAKQENNHLFKMIEEHNQKDSVEEEEETEFEKLMRELDD